MSLQERFVRHFATKDEITTQEIYEWYCSVKSNPQNLPYRSAVHALLIDPLLYKGVLVKIGHGVYALRLSTPPEPAVQAVQAAQDEKPLCTEDLGTDELTDDDAFEEYIQQKLKA